VSTGTTKLDVTVSDVVAVNDLVTRFHFRRRDGDLLPTFSGGAHVVVEMRDGARTRLNPYSLMGSPLDTRDYTISVRRDDVGRGGSLFMHNAVKPGHEMVISYPVNLFSLDLRARKHLMLAGGIGITPFMAQLEDLHQGRVPYELHYCVRSPEHAAFLPRLREREGGRLHLYYDSEGQAIDFDQLLSDQPLGTHVYVCGPAGMIDRVTATARTSGWPDSHLHWEQFSAPPVGDAFDVFLARSKVHVHVQPDQSLMESIEAAGVEVPYLCRGGVCGFCQTRVLEIDGEIVHNDHYLSDAERGKFMMPCVSRARCKSLVLDL
jgi:dimethylamine monooxygenase subunit B